MASWNGGVTQRQLAWLREQLAEAEAASERVLTASHHQVTISLPCPACPPACPPARPPAGPTCLLTSHPTRTPAACLLAQV